MSNKYLEKIAGMQSIFFKPKTTSGLAPKYLTPDTTRTIKPVKSVMETKARELTKAAGILGDTAKLLGQGVSHAGNVVAGTGTLLARTGQVLSGKSRNEVAYLHAAKLNPHMTDKQINEFVGQSDDAIRKHMLQHNPSAIEDFNTQVNARKAGRTLVVGGLATAAVDKYRTHKQNEEQGMYGQY